MWACLSTVTGVFVLFQLQQKTIETLLPAESEEEVRSCCNKNDDLKSGNLFVILEFLRMGECSCFWLSYLHKGRLPSSVFFCIRGSFCTLRGDKVSMLIHTYPHKLLWKVKWPSAITRLTAHFACGLMSDLVTCKHRKSAWSYSYDT